MNTLIFLAAAALVLGLAIWADRSDAQSRNKQPETEGEPKNVRNIRKDVIAHTTIHAQLYGYTGEYYNETTGVHIQCLVRMRTPEDVHDFIEYQLTK